MVHVLVINRLQTLGVTQPLLAMLKDKDGEPFLAFIKVKGNPEGVRCLINELISYRLASELGLLMPHSGIALIDENTTDNSGMLTQDSFGYCFYSRQIPKADKLIPRIMRYIENKDMYEKIILFDHIIYNTDRNPGNLLIAYKKAEKIIYAIDHTHVFKNQAIWDSLCLKRGIAENDFLDTDIINSSASYSMFYQDKPITLKSLMAATRVFKEKCDISLIYKVVDDLPVDWLISKDDIEALKCYLLYRVSHLEDMCNLIVRTKGWKNE